MVFVGFSTPRRWNPLSALIRFMTRSETSHAWLLVEDPTFQMRLVMEAHSSGFRLLSFARFVRDNRVVALVQTAHPLASGLPDAGLWLGEAFDVKRLVRIFLMLVGRWFRLRLRAVPTSRALFCSEAVVRTLKAAGYPGAACLGDETTTPGEVLAFLRAEPANVVYERDQLRLWRHLVSSGRAAPWPAPRPDGVEPGDAPPGLAPA